jgi:hypothetical protein
MSVDIFISYRHGTTDSWVAGRLRDRLEEDFAVYFDTSRQFNDFGDDFARTIDQALTECRVMFVVMGPDWTSAEGMRRLEQPADWVRHELQVALARGDSLRVVPLFIGTGKAPDLSSVPSDLRALSTRNGRPLNPDFWDLESEDLVSRLKGEWLTVKRGAARLDVRLPPVLPYLCNRREQEDRLVELIQAEPVTAPVACLIHGHKWEAHDEFLDRLRYQGALEDILGARDTGLAVHAIQLSRDRLRDGRPRDALISALKATVVRRRAATDAELRGLMAKMPQPLVVVVQLTWADLDGLGARPVQDLVSAWRALLKTDAAAQLPTLPHPALLWINVTYDDGGADLGAEAPDVSLPRLQPIESVHIREWLGLDEVRSRVADRKHELEDLPEQERYWITPGKLHMRRFADGVREIMSRA